MASSKTTSRVPSTRIPQRQQIVTSNKQEDKFYKKTTINEVSKTVTTTNKPAGNNLQLPRIDQRSRILSDTALLSPRKKLKTSRNISRAPLVDLKVSNGNIQQKTVHVVETLKIQKGVETVHYQQKVQKITDTKRTDKDAEKIYHSNYTKFVDYKKVEPELDHKKVSSVNVDSLLKVGGHREKLCPRTVSSGSAAVSSELDPTITFYDFNDYSRKRVSLLAKIPINHVIKHKPNPISPINSHVRIGSTAVLFQGIPKDVKRPLKKVSLIPRSLWGSRRSAGANRNEALTDVSDDEYLEDIIKYQIRNDYKHLLYIQQLKRYNSKCMQNRTAIVNWLIRAQDYLDLPVLVLFNTVVLFDKVLQSTSVACNMYQLVGITIFWIVSKYEDNVNYISESKLRTLCKGVYTSCDLLSMERKLLTFFNFDLHIPDLTVYIMFYIRKLTAPHDILLHGALYILECYSLNLNFSTFTNAKKAAAAVCLTLRTLLPLDKSWIKLDKKVCYYTEEELSEIMNEMSEQLNKVHDPSYAFREPYEKYAAKDKSEISIVFLHKMVAT